MGHRSIDLKKSRILDNRLFFFFVFEIIYPVIVYQRSTVDVFSQSDGVQFTETAFFGNKIVQEVTDSVSLDR